jgi:hypothetical protein
MKVFFSSMIADELRSATNTSHNYRMAGFAGKMTACFDEDVEIHRPDEPTANRIPCCIAVDCMTTPSTTATLPPTREAPVMPRETGFSIADILQLTNLLFEMDINDETSATLAATVVFVRAPTAIAKQPPLAMPPDVEEGLRAREQSEQVLSSKIMVAFSARIGVDNVSWLTKAKATAPPTAADAAAAAEVAATEHAMKLLAVIAA